MTSLGRLNPTRYVQRGRVAVVVFLIALMVRLCYLIYGGEPPGGEAEMERAAASLATKGVLGDVYGPGSGPSAHVAPLYAFFLSVIYWIFGPFTTAARYSQGVAASICTAAAISLIPGLGQRLRLHRYAGVLAALTLSVSPFNLWIETSGSWEQPFAALFLLLGIGTAAVLHDTRWASMRATGLFAVVVASSALLSPAVFVAGSLVMATEIALRMTSVRVWSGACIVAAAVALCVIPWGLRNQSVLGGFVRCGAILVWNFESGTTTVQQAFRKSSETRAGNLSACALHIRSLTRASVNVTTEWENYLTWPISWRRQ